MPNNLLKAGGVTVLIVVGAILGVFALLLAYVLWKQHAFDKLGDTRDLASRIGTMADTYLATRPRAALVIGVHQRGRDWVGGFGSVDGVAGGPRPTGDTLFEIGSITKVFTGLVLADAVNRGLVSLDEPLAGLLPPDTTLPDGPARELTLRQLATHTAGLPRLPADFWDQARPGAANPYADYSIAELLASLAQLKLNRPPGQGYEYSNYGAALLGQTLAISQREPYPDLLQRLILGPLEMADTALTVPEENRARLVGGFSPAGEMVSHWDFDAFAPAGGLRSSANDLLKFIRAALQPGDNTPGRALKLSLQVHSGTSPEKVGLGWHQLTTIENLTLWWHNGGTGGYVSYLGIDPAHQTGVVVLANYGDALAGKFDVDKIGVNILTLAAKVSLEE